MSDCKGIRYASLSLILLRPRISTTISFFFGLFAGEIDRSPNYEHGVSIFGKIFGPLHFSLAMQFIKLFVNNCSVLGSDWINFGCICFGSSFGVDGHPLVLWYFYYSSGIKLDVKINVHHFDEINYAPSFPGGPP